MKLRVALLAFLAFLQGAGGLPFSPAPSVAAYNESARVYLNPNTGRFWTQDSFEGSPNTPLSLHKYLYAHDDTVNRVDPSGNFTVGEALGATGIAAGIFTLGFVADHYLFEPLRAQARLSRAKAIPSSDLQRVLVQLREFQNVVPVGAKFDELISAIEDERIGVYLSPHPERERGGRHHILAPGRLFILQAEMQVNDDLYLALIVFGEWQHDVGKINYTASEQEAQRELREVREAIRRVAPNRITPAIEVLRHGGNSL
jgi:RHS repeat-associated protein